jgi:hypothetical protein
MHGAAKGMVVNPLDEDEHLFRRLGAAAVKHWDLLSAHDQELLLDQATMTTVATNETVQLRQQLELLIRQKRINKNVG